MSVEFVPKKTQSLVPTGWSIVTRTGIIRGYDMNASGPRPVDAII